MDFDTFDTDLWSEIQDSDLEIFDIPEDFDRSKFFGDDHLDVNFTQMLNSTYSFTGDTVTFLGLIGVISTAIIVVSVFRSYFNSPLRK